MDFIPELDLTPILQELVLHYNDDEKLKQIAFSLREAMKQLTQTGQTLAGSHDAVLPAIFGHIEKRVPEYTRTLRWRKIFSFGLWSTDIERMSFEQSLQEAVALRDSLTLPSHPAVQQLLAAQEATTRLLMLELLRIAERPKDANLGLLRALIEKVVSDESPH